MLNDFNCQVFTIKKRRHCPMMLFVPLQASNKTKRIQKLEDRQPNYRDGRRAPRSRSKEKIHLSAFLEMLSVSNILPYLFPHGPHVCAQTKRLCSHLTNDFARYTKLQPLQACKEIQVNSARSSKDTSSFLYTTPIWNH